MYKIRTSFILPVVCLLYFSGYAQRLTKQKALEMASSEYAKQVELQKPALLTDWEQKQVSFGDYQMKFSYRILGDKPADGRSLYISLHGGGNTSAKANDQQWKNQISLYTPAEGVYLAPRAPTNTWNLWHEDHIDTLFLKIIKAAILAEGVNPNKVYVMGYSAGGDGVFQIAPRMADHWAAAAMMAGHPGDAAALNLRNLPFTIFMGGADAAYKRNELAAVWGKRLDSLESANPGSYKHDLHIYPEAPHWMSRKDTVAVPWMAAFKRNPLPSKVAWKQDDRHHDTFYWLGVPAGQAKTGAESIVTVAGNEITIEKNENPELRIFLNDHLLDLDKKINVVYNGEVVFKGKVRRNAGLIAQTACRLDPGFIFSAMLMVRGKVIHVYK
ncbi:dienelactone hydrolase family protein [Pedobacter ginsengisoli]|uniref:dienelactone hydrolase family protein n=1 Tax=Pedobacter ginsengisoli TaxID=363852 RepID=UPI00254BE479|nr:dienelactone hydrolase family protein [Pedobacter ginsengisoli]